MSKEELFKKYQEIVLKTNGGADDYVVALCQISNLIKEFAEEKDQQITDLQKQLAVTKKALELTCETLQDINFKIYNTEMNFVDFFKQQAKEMLENEYKI